MLVGSSQRVRRRGGEKNVCKRYTHRVVGAVEVGGVFTGEGRVGAEEGVLSVIRLPEGEVGLVLARAGEAAWSARLGGGADDEGGGDEAGDGQEAEHGLYGMGKECKEC
jgi:hypothetical protein